MCMTHPLMLYHILLPINQYSGNSTTHAMSDIKESQWLFHQTISSESLAHCIGPQYCIRSSRYFKFS